MMIPGNLQKLERDFPSVCVPANLQENGVHHKIILSLNDDFMS